MARKLVVPSRAAFVLNHRFAVRDSRHEGIRDPVESADDQTMRNSELQVEAGATMTEYARTLSVLTIFCLAAFALVAVAGYLT